MGFATICGTFNTKLVVLVSGRDILVKTYDFGFINKSNCKPSEVELHEKFDICLHRDEIKVRGSLTDWDAISARDKDLSDDVPPLIEGHGNEDNKITRMFRT